jgi:hypothetical protein
MEFPELLDTLAAAQGQEVWVAVGSRSGGPPPVAVMRGELGAPDIDEVEGGGRGVAFFPVDAARPAGLHGRLGLYINPADFETAEGSLPGDLRITLRDLNVHVETG